MELRPGITGPASLKYRDEEEMIAEFVSQCQTESFRLQNNVPPDLSDEQTAIWYNDNVIYLDKVRINLYCLDHYSLTFGRVCSRSIMLKQALYDARSIAAFTKDFQMILCTILEKKMEYNGEVI